VKTSLLLVSVSVPLSISLNSSLDSLFALKLPKLTETPLATRTLVPPYPPCECLTALGSHSAML